VNVRLSNEERLGLKAIALRYGVKPEELVRRFVSDLTGSLDGGGSDEALHATAWLDRRMTLEAQQPVTPNRQRRVEKLQFLAYQARNSEKSARLDSRHTTAQDTQ
jgi:hypothetical protein